MRYFRRSTRTDAVAAVPGDLPVTSGPGAVSGSSLFGGRRRARIALVLAAVLLIGAVTYLMHSSSAPAAEKLRVVRATYGDVTVTVGGVGRIVPSGSTSAAVLTTATTGGSTSGGTSQGGGAATAPVDAVFARTTGTVSLLLVEPGQRVVAGQPIAVLDDAGASANAVRQLQNDVAVARLEVQRMLHPLSPADLSSLALEVRRAQADLETLRGGTAADRARAIRIARRNAQLANRRLDLVLHPRTAADVAAAQAEVNKAEADLAALRTPPPLPPPAALAAAQAAVDAARARQAKLTGPPDPAAVNAARLDVAKAEADLALLQQQVPPASTAEISAAQGTLDAANARLAQVLAPSDPAEVAAATADLRKAEADLDALLTPAPRPTAASVTAAQSVLAAAREKLASLRLPPLPSDIAAARLDLERAVSELRTVQTGPNPAALAAARAAVTTARTRLAKPYNPQDIDLARARLTSTETQLSAAQVTLDVLTVRAVSDGTVTSVLTEPGAPVDAVTAVAVVSDLGRMAADVEVSEFDAALVQRGMRAVLSVDALGGKSYPGVVLYAAPTGSDSGGVVNFPVRVSLGNADGPKAGMNVSVRIIVNERRHVIQIPLEAVSGGGHGKGTVKVLGAGGRVTSRTVELGLANNKVVEVVDGVRVGEHLVLGAASGESDE